MEESNTLPPGFRFHPTDEELINYYLKSKVCDANGFTCKAIAVVDFNKSEPWDLPGKASMGEKLWYFFSLRDRKYPTGLRTNRATESGYWKTTGKDKHIFHGGSLVGFKKTLVFYQGRAPRGLKTNWVMHEYRLHNNNMPHFTPSKEEWVVCRVFQKSISAAKKPHLQEMTSSSLDNSPNCEMVNELGDDVELANFNASLSNSSTELGFITNNIINNNNSSSSNNINTTMNLMGSSSNNYWSSSSNAAIIDQVPSLVPWLSNNNSEASYYNNNCGGLMLNNNPNPLSMNSLLLKVLQLKTYHQQQQANNNGHFVASSSTSYMSQEASNVGGTDDSQQQQPFNNLHPLW